MSEKLSEYARRNIHLDYTTMPGAKNDIVNGIAALEQRMEGLKKVKDAVVAVKREIDEGRPQYANEGLQYVFEALAAMVGNEDT